MMVCAGNLCRSPFAEGLMRNRLQQAGIETECYSRGLIAMPGRKAPDTAVKVAAEFGVDLSAHVSQPLLRPDIERAGLVLVMEPAQRQHLIRMSPSSIGKVFLLSQSSHSNPVPDPVGQDEEVFRAVYDAIAVHIEAWLQRFGVA
jgi:low molecular weight protein-tyrosine phosphatase